MSKESDELKTDIQNVATALRKLDICSDVSPLQQAYSSVTDLGNSSYRSSVFNLKFDKIPIPRNLGYKSVKSFIVLLDVTIREKEIDINEIVDPIIIENVRDNYLFSVKIECMNRLTKHIDSWHIDYEPKNDKEYLHPMFHLTHGGRCMDDIEVGQTMKLVVPRLPFYPLDVVLGVDFIVGNFYTKDIYLKLRSNTLYNRALKNSQRRLWRPFFLALSKIWNNNPSLKMEDDELPAKLHPYLIIS